MTRKMPTGGKHGPCVTHVPHPYTSNGWLCVNDEPGRAESMIELADELASIKARHHEAEALRPAADGTYARWSVPVDTMPDGRPVMPGGVCAAKDTRKGPSQAWCTPGAYIHLHTMGGPGFRSKCIGHTCPTAVPNTEEAPVPTAKPASVKARKTSTRHIHRTADGDAVFAGMVCAECGHAPITQSVEYTGGQESQILSPGARTVVPEYTGPDDGPTATVAAVPTTRATIVDYSRPAPAGFRFEVPGVSRFALPGPIVPDVVLALDPDYPPDALDIYDERANIDAARAVIEAPAEYSPQVVELARTILAPARSLIEPTRPEPIPASRTTLAIVPDARASDDRPRCARCGQTFRKSGTGAKWHAINRPDCAAEYRRATA